MGEGLQSRKVNESGTVCNRQQYRPPERTPARVRRTMVKGNWATKRQRAAEAAGGFSRRIARRAETGRCATGPRVCSFFHRRWPR